MKDLLDLEKVYMERREREDCKRIFYSSIVTLYTDRFI